MHQLFCGSCEQQPRLQRHYRDMELPRREQLNDKREFICAFRLKNSSFSLLFLFPILVLVKPPDVVSVSVSRFDGDHSSVYAELFGCCAYP